jgi:hypothetical protein
LLSGELVLNDLITVLKTDFAKYRKHTPLLLLNEVFESVMRQTDRSQSGNSGQYAKPTSLYEGKAY